MRDLNPKSYLEHARLMLGRKTFAVGIFERGITLYRQQMRALNLIHAMLMTAPLKPGSKIAVIGGGAFGMTAAAAGAWVGYEVKLYERHPVDKSALLRLAKSRSRKQIRGATVDELAGRNGESGC
jgi:NADPH-dependent 2,4-dienoyl-CoA reductase/sulfur reductase-like enzyme